MYFTSAHFGIPADECVFRILFIHSEIFALISWVFPLLELTGHVYTRGEKAIFVIQICQFVRT